MFTDTSVLLKVLNLCLLFKLVKIKLIQLVRSSRLLYNSSNSYIGVVTGGYGWALPPPPIFYRDYVSSMANRAADTLPFIITIATLPPHLSGASYATDYIQWI